MNFIINIILIYMHVYVFMDTAKKIIMGRIRMYD